MWSTFSLRQQTSSKTQHILLFFCTNREWPETAHPLVMKANTHVYCTWTHANFTRLLILHLRSDGEILTIFACSSVLRHPNSIRDAFKCRVTITYPYSLNFFPLFKELLHSVGDRNTYCIFVSCIFVLNSYDWSAVSERTFHCHIFSDILITLPKSVSPVCSCRSPCWLVLFVVLLLVSLFFFEVYWLLANNRLWLHSNSNILLQHAFLNILSHVSASLYVVLISMWYFPHHL